MANIEITELLSKAVLNANDLFMSKDQGDNGDYKVTLNQITSHISDNLLNQLSTVAATGEYSDLLNIPDTSIDYPVLASGSTATNFFTPDNGSSPASYDMPTAPVDGQVVAWVAPPTLYSTNSLTFNVTDKDIEGDAVDLVWDLDGIGGKLVFSASADEWKAFKDTQGVA